ncbi:hypothetical protein IFM89_005434 [Coptis chinensis]|uniref:F-box protein n=1 Tax=Coptis chinensis TaxID=261450 RepID=A0A835IUW2_9MAGN|nr:hypothetical protein IFM89_005434 [Coptis chinensis]
MYVFSPTTEKWTKHYLTVEPCINGSLWSVRYLFFDGSLYTLSISGHLLKFDLQLSCCRAIELPHVVVEAASIGCLGVSQGSLHYSWSDGQSSMTMRVWMLKVDEWVLPSVSNTFTNIHSAVTFLVLRVFLFLDFIRLQISFLLEISGEYFVMIRA